MNRTPLIMVSAAVLTLGAILSFRVEAQESGGLARWEYQVVLLAGESGKPGSLSWNGATAELDDERRIGGSHPTAAALEACLNKMGRDGWELIEHGDRYALFKRPGR